jgi:LysM repeat protein
MARYRGRHRAPSTTGRTIARTALAGAVAGAPLLAAAPAANAAPDSVWDRVAQCESSGNWNINTGNGFSGGLQFTSSTWRAFGGAQFATAANQATREQQIIVAERVLAGQGWGAWPVCSRKAGATSQPVTLRNAAPAAPKAAPAAPKPAAAPATGGDYVIQRGDTLSSIATRQHVTGGYRALLAKNPAMKNPNRIFPGQHLKV